ncbi:conjugal transfer protein TraA [Rhizobium sp. BK376]|uniref:conjugal transfer protein TraA n=1 Tax=Rhizobium sp. BK376 TaxID=2512149 RepID=UPI00104642AE|nr:conjugal transfer protein TraA [Rhizobium sp. BK376]TCR80824.1 hypothetical protein EV561_113101 [Rhizobium sp. BK376]
MEIFLGAFLFEWEQRRAVLLHERSLGAGPSWEEELRRRRVGGSERNFDGRRTKRRGSGFSQSDQRQVAARPMSQRFGALARGSQPAVVKVASYGGRARLGAMISYVARNGEIAIESHLGELLRGKSEIASIGQAWEDLMSARAESRDIGVFRMRVSQPVRSENGDFDEARAILKSGLGNRSFAFNVSRGEDGGYRIEGVVVLRDGQGERLTADAKAIDIVRARMSAASVAGRTIDDFRFTGYGNGVDYGTARLRSLVDRHAGAVETGDGQRVSDSRQAGDLVQQQWRHQFHSRRPRDVLHLVLSARAGTDRQAFRAAARDFLASEFASHRYVFALHDPFDDPKGERQGGRRPHVHVHAVVAMRSEDGERIETTIASFRRWREGLATQARAQGIDMEMTDRRERANAPAYGRNQVRPTSHVGRTQHVGTSLAAQRRYDEKRTDVPHRARSEASRAYADTARGEWHRLTRESEAARVRGFARDQLSRFETADRAEGQGVPSRRAADQSRPQLKIELANLSRLLEIDDMNAMTRPEFEIYEKRVETALFQAERLVAETARDRFREIATAARAHVEVRREMMEEAERDGAPAARDRTALTADDRRWEEAVARHGLKTVEVANEAMLVVEYYRQRIALADRREIADDANALRASLNVELTRAAKLGAAGNSLIREIAEVDVELKSAIAAADHLRDRSGHGGRRDQATRSSTLMHETESERLADRPEDHAKGKNAGDMQHSSPNREDVPRQPSPRRNADEHIRRDGDDHDR